MAKFCENCGTALADDSRFCVSCGRPVAAPAATSAPTAPTAPTATAAPTAPAVPTAPAEQPIQPQYNFQSAPPQFGAPKPKGSKPPVWVWIIIAAVVVAGLAVGTFFLFFAGKGGEPPPSGSTSNEVESHVQADNADSSATMDDIVGDWSGSARCTAVDGVRGNESFFLDQGLTEENIDQVLSCVGQDYPMEMTVEEDGYLSNQTRWGARMNNITMVDAMVNDGLWCPENNVHMAVIGGGVATELGVTREMQDAWAYRSQMRWAEGEAKGCFDDERFPVEVVTKKETVTVARDEAPRPTTTMEGLAALPVLFTKDGSITAGNAPGTNDGASAVVIMSREKAEELHVPILATIRDYAQVSRESRYISTVPGYSIQKILDRNKLTLDDIDLIEINEAFASVPLVSGLRILNMTPEEMDAKVNVNGGAVAVGHPIGATGARILMTLINELKREGKKNGICAICSGMAQGDAMWIEIN